MHARTSLPLPSTFWLLAPSLLPAVYLSANDSTPRSADRPVLPSQAASMPSFLAVQPRLAYLCIAAYIAASLQGVSATCFTPSGPGGIQFGGIYSASVEKCTSEKLC